MSPLPRGARPHVARSAEASRTDRQLRGRVAVVIVDYRSETWLRRCLTSLVSLGRKDLSFIVVDNGQAIDGSRLETDFSDLTVIRPEQNLGFAGGCNLGLRHAIAAGAEYVLLLNPDTRAEQDFIEPLVRSLSENGRLGAAGPTIRRDDEACGLLAAGGRVNLWLGRPSNRLDESLMGRRPYATVPFLTGCALMLRPEVVRQVGLMVEDYFLYFEDADYGMRFRQAGWDLAYVPDALIFHEPASVVGYHSERYVFYYARNRVWFVRRWGYWYHYTVFLSFTALIKLPAAIVVFGFVRRRPGLVRAFLRGFWEGVTARPAMLRRKGDDPSAGLNPVM